jgi:putative FmdB family regulatory protein
MTYEYVCEACGHQWEAEQSIKDSALKKCVSCGAEKAKRLVSGGTGFLLKGGGWYADLYGSPGAGTKAASTEDKSGKAGTSGTKTEAPAASGDKAASGGESKPATTSAPSTSTSGTTAPSTASTPAASKAKAS